MICDRETCRNADCIAIESSGNIVIPSADEFITNLLHLKCKVVDLVRKQMQKEIPELDDANYASYLRSARRPGPMRLRKSLSKESVEPLREKESSQDEKVVEEKTKVLANTPERLRDNTIPVSNNSTVAEQTNDAPVQTDSELNNFIHWLKRILSICLPFYWIIVAIGILGFTSLLCGILLGAFICTNGNNGFSFFSWSQSRVGHAFY